MSDLIRRQDAIDKAILIPIAKIVTEDKIIYRKAVFVDDIEKLPSAETEDYTEMKREFIRMAEYIDMFLECSDEQKETLIGFISRLAEFMPWTEMD